VSSQESNAERMRFFVEQVQEGGRVELIDELVRPDFRNRTAEPEQRDDREGVRQTMAAMHEAFSDLRIEILHCVADGEFVATHKMIRGRTGALG
jgi:predicted ester cyclase